MSKFPIPAPMHLPPVHHYQHQSPVSYEIGRYDLLPDNTYSHTIELYGAIVPTNIKLEYDGKKTDTLFHSHLK